MKRGKGLNPMRNTERAKMVRELDGLWRELIHTLCHERCMLCGATEALHCAHLVGKGENPSLRHDLMNGVLLCLHCHDDIDGRNGVDRKGMAWALLKRKYPHHYEWVQENRRASRPRLWNADLRGWIALYRETIKAQREGMECCNHS